MATKHITAERLRSVFHYDPDTGLFTRLVRTGARSILGVPITKIGANGYVMFSLDGRIDYAHRMAWLYVHGVMPEHEIDHINGIRSDNRIVNLRHVSRALNAQNMRARRADTFSGYLGVHKARDKWQARIKVNGKKYSIGVYTTPEEAHAAYVKAKRRMHPGGML